MSLIAVAQQVRGPRTLTRTLLLLVVVTAAIIVGLLAMHSLNTHGTTTGHASAATASASQPMPLVTTTRPPRRTPQGQPLTPRVCGLRRRSRDGVDGLCSSAPGQRDLARPRAHRVAHRRSRRCTPCGASPMARVRPYRPTALSHCSLHQSHVMTRPPASHTGNASSARQSSRRITDLERTSPMKTRTAATAALTLATALILAGCAVGTTSGGQYAGDGQRHAAAVLLLRSPPTPTRPTSCSPA